MRLAIFAVLALIGCSAQTIMQVAPNQYLITGSGMNALVKADIKAETLCKNPRYPRTSMTVDAAEAHWRKNIECVLDYEAVPIAKNSYRIRGSGTDTCAHPDCGQGGPNWAAVDLKIANSGRDYCAKTHKVVMVTDGSFDLGVGVEVDFRCVSPREVESQIHAATCDGCGLTADSPEAAVAYCNMRDLFPVLKRTAANGMGFKRGVPVAFSCVKRDNDGSEPAPLINGATPIENR
jgi:hypothetical protein